MITIILDLPGFEPPTNNSDRIKRLSDLAELGLSAMRKIVPIDTNKETIEWDVPRWLMSRLRTASQRFNLSIEETLSAGLKAGWLETQGQLPSMYSNECAENLAQRVIRGATDAMSKQKVLTMEIDPCVQTAQVVCSLIQKNETPKAPKIAVAVRSLERAVELAEQFREKVETGASPQIADAMVRIVFDREHFVDSDRLAKMLENPKGISVDESVLATTREWLNSGGLPKSSLAERLARFAPCLSWLMCDLRHVAPRFPSEYACVRYTYDQKSAGAMALLSTKTASANDEVALLIMVHSTLVESIALKRPLTGFDLLVVEDADLLPDKVGEKIAPKISLGRLHWHLKQTAFWKSRRAGSLATAADKALANLLASLPRYSGPIDPRATAVSEAIWRLEAALAPIVAKITNRKGDLEESEKVDRNVPRKYQN